MIVVFAILNEQHDIKLGYRTIGKSQGSSTPLRLKYSNSSAMHILASVDRLVPDDVNGTQKRLS